MREVSYYLEMKAIEMNNQETFMKVFYTSSYF